MVSIFGKSSMPNEPLKKNDLIELDWEHRQMGGGINLKVVGIAKFADVDHVLDAIRDKRTIAVMKFSQDFFSDKTEVKRSIRRVQKTVYAIGGDIAGLSEDIIIVTPPVVNVERRKGQAPSEDNS